MMDLIKLMILGEVLKFKHKERRSIVYSVLVDCYKVSDGSMKATVSKHLSDLIDMDYIVFDDNHYCLTSNGVNAIKEVEPIISDLYVKLLSI